MIAQLTGTLAYKSPEYLIVDVGGVGYQVFVSLNSFYKIGECGAAVRLAVHTHVREDALHLFGFVDPAEKGLFLLLVAVSGVGPKLALNILSGMPTEELRAALQAGDLARLVRIPGIGKKTAERLVLELRDKIKSIDGVAAAAPLPTGEGIDSEAVSALINLGYRQVDAEKAVKTARGAGATTLEAIIRTALRQVVA